MLQSHRTAARICAAALVLALAVPALAEEYTVETFVGGYTTPAGTPTDILGANEDDTTAGVNLPFEFPYFGRRYDRISVCSNGWLAFGSTTLTTSVNPALPSASAPNGVLAPLWDDLDTGSGVVRTFVEGTAPTRVFVVDWNGVGSFDGSASGLAFQARLHEGSGVVEFAYALGGDFTGLSYTAALEDPTGTIAFSASGAGNSMSTAPAADARFTPRDVIVAGRVLRDRPVADATGLGNSTETGLAVEGATVWLVREDTGERGASAVTAADGSFTLRGLGIDMPTTLAVDLVTEGDGARVIGGDSTPYVHRIAAAVDADPATVLPTVTLDSAVDATNAPFRRALNIQQALERGRRAAQAAADAAAQELPVTSSEPLPLLIAQWSLGTAPAGGTAYTPENGLNAARLVVSDAPANPDPYDDDVLLRAYGLHVLANLSVSPAALPQPHGFRTTTTPEFAWAEGFGFFFASAVQGRETSIDTLSDSLASVSSLEAPPAGTRGVDVAGAVAGSLWDLVDAANELTDEYEGTNGPTPSDFQRVMTTIDRDLDALPEGRTAFTIRDFFTAFRDSDSAEDTAARPQVARAFIGLGTLPDDSAEPDDRLDEATPGIVPGTKVGGRTLSPENEDVFRVDLVGPNPQLLEIGLEIATTDVDATLVLADGTGGLIDFTSNEGDTSSSRRLLRVAPAVALPPGTYHVRVRNDGAASGDYSLSVHNPLALTGVETLAWTEGVALKEDFVASGGIAPYTYTSSTGGAPGLATAEGGSRIVGTPAAAGEYTLDISVDDTGAPLNTIARMVPLTVNPALSVAPLLAVAEDRTISRVIGRGGTDPEWTPELQPPAGLTLIGGAQLMLTGTTGSPRAFDVAARAQDAVGAVLPPSPSQVVVTRDVFAADGTPIPSAGLFGYFLDALEGSRVHVELRFRGSGSTPEVIGFIDDFGTPFLPESDVDDNGRKIVFDGPLTRATGRYHLLLDPMGFAGTVLVEAKVKPPKKFIGEAAIQPAGTVIEVAVDALEGATVKVKLERSPSPSSLEPTVVSIDDPDGNAVALPTERRRRRGREVVLKFVAPRSGRYVMRFSGRDGTSGPLFYKVRVKTPRKTRLVLD